MKKKLVIMLSFAMVFTFALAACGGGGGEDLSDSKYIGTWVADSLSVAGESGEIDGGVFKLTLNGDGTGTFTSIEADGTEEVSNVTWSTTKDGFKTKGDIELKFKDNGDDIAASVFGVKLNFSREEEGAAADGAAYGYAGDDPVELACYKYMAEEISKQYDAAEVSIPTVKIVHEDFTPEDEVLVYGDFWIENYNVNGDVLECVSGGNYPGCMHVSKETNEVTAFDVVEDGEGWDQSAKDIFGDQYDAFIAAHSDSDARDELRKITVSDYVNLNGLDVNYYQDYGWDPVELIRN